MDSRYWIGRSRAELALARKAVTPEARLAHYALSGRYSIMAGKFLPVGNAGGPTQPAGERAVLHLADPRLPQREPDLRQDPAESLEERR